MSFDDVAIHDGSVARMEAGGDVVLGFYGRKVRSIMYLDCKIVVFQIAYPVATTASGRCPIYFDEYLFT
jgi:hypothetical protein